MLLHSIVTLQFWLFILLGLSHFGTRTDARAVNISNTWTMPQEGLNVFYRFFRDRISWFEADAVCQFHHANLVTVDNSFQFDATRDLLRELDVNDIVWIGLMRPQSSERFMWSNSRPLVTDTGYWAESLPLMDAPLCAVIDPIRDYRWHALRCGGPETASFLCEMPVPSWADACILKDMPNLTMQYMADTASIELIRNCAEEGLLKQSCKGKKDRDRALRELICPRERLEAQRINDITNSHFKSLQIINSIRTDNNENNDIELLPLGETSYGSGSSSDISEQVPTEKNTVQRLIEQFNVDELMQADEAAMPVSNYHIPGEIPKPVKKAAKKVIVANGGEYQKKYRSQKYEESVQLPPPKPKPSKQQQLLALEDMMMGDQPQQSGEPEMMEHVGPEEDEVSNEITEPLPHKKKVLPQDLKTMPPITEAKSSEEELSDEKPAQQLEKRTFVDTTVAASSTITAVPATTAAPTTTTDITTTTTTTTTTTSSAPTTTITPSTTVKLILAATNNTPQAKEIETTIRTQHAVVGSNHQAHITTTAPGPLSTARLDTSSTTSAHTHERDGHIYRSSSAAPHTTLKPIDLDVTESPATIGHPMHPQQQQQQRGYTITEESQHSHVKESADNSHFIPPMLLVKSHYVPPQKHNEHSGGEHHGIDMHGGPPMHGGHDSLKAGDATTIKAHEIDIEAMTTTRVTTTMSTEKSPPTTTDSAIYIDDLTKEVSDKMISLEKQQQQQLSKLNTKLIDSTTVASNQQQQQQNDMKVSIKGQSVMDSEAQDITKNIENGEKHFTTTTTTAHTTTASFTTLTSAVNKLHSIAMPTTKPKAVAVTTTAATTTLKTTVHPQAMPSTTMKSADVTVSHEIEKPVKREPQTKEVEKLTKEMSAKTTNIAVEMPVVTAAAKTDELQTMKIADTTQNLMLVEPTIKTTNTPAEIKQHASTATLTDGATSTTTTIVAAPTSASAVTATTTTTTTAHAITTTACNSDTDTEESTPTDTTTTTEDANGTKLTRIPRTCQPRIEQNSRKHTKHHGNTITTEPPTPTHNFMKEATDTPRYKPNRHRVLTQPESVSYFKKVLG